MAEIAGVISLPDLRAELRLAATADELLLARHRAAAVAFVERWLGRNILDRNLDATAEVPARTGSPLVFQVSDAKTAASRTIHYRPASAGPGAARDRSLATDSGNERREVERVTIWPGEDGWPLMERNTPALITFAVGIAAENIPPDWSQAVAMVVREIYDGSALDGLAGNSMLSALLGNYTRRVAYAGHPA